MRRNLGTVKLIFGGFLDKLEPLHVNKISLLYDTIYWLFSTKGFNYWSDKWLNCRSHYTTYINKQ